MKLDFEIVVLAVLAVLAGILALVVVMHILNYDDSEFADYYILGDDKIYGCNGSVESLDNCGERSNVYVDDEFESKTIDGYCEQNMMLVGFPSIPIFYITCKAT